jgi:hypothetical protein
MPVLMSVENHSLTEWEESHECEMGARAYSA